MKKGLRIASLLAGLALVVGACSGGTSATEEPSVSAEPAASAESMAPASGEPASAPLEGNLEIWHTYASGAGTEKTTYDEIIADIMAKNPGLTITTTVQNFFSPNSIFDKYALEVPTGGGPDMFIVPNDSLGAQVRQSLLQPLDDIVPADQLAQFHELAVEGCRVDGKLYCVPESLKAVGFYYDKTAIPNPPTTTDELLAGVTDGSIKLGVNQGAYHNFGYWGAFGGELMDDTGKCVADTTGTVDAHKFFADLKAAGAEWSGFNNYAKVADAFKQGQINALVDGPWASGGYLETLGAEKLGVAALPAGPDAPSQPITGTDGWFVNPNSENQELAAQVALLISTEYEQQFVDKAGHIPALKSATISDPITVGFAEAVANGFPRPQVKELDNFWTNFDNALNAVIDKGTDPQQAVADACAAMNKANNL